MEGLRAEDVKQFLKRYGFFIILLIIIIVISTIIWGKSKSGEKAEEMQEPPVIYESTEVIVENEPTQNFMEEPEDSKEISLYATEKPDSILIAVEEQNLQKEAMSAAEQCVVFYKDVSISYPQTSYSYIADFSNEQRKEIVKFLGEQGFISVSDDINMENYQKIEEFYSEYSSGSDAMVTVFSVYKDGNIGSLTFVHRNGKIQTYYVTIGWQEGGIPEIKSFGSKEAMRYLTKGIRRTCGKDRNILIICLPTLELLFRRLRISGETMTGRLLRLWMQ